MFGDWLRGVDFVGVENCPFPFTKPACDVQNDVPLHGHFPGDGFSICQSPHRQHSAVGLRQTRSQSDVASVANIVHRLPVKTLLYTSPDAVVDRVEFGLFAG